MSLALLVVAIIAFLSFAYHAYGRWVAKHFGLDDQRTTPAHLHQDGVDYVPTSRFALFAQHFSAIAAAGPIAGPIVACQSFGWLPCLLWICLGVVFIGAVHDFSTLFLSVRHSATTMADITKHYLGSKAGKAMMIFIWLSLVYIVVAFTDITASSFTSRIEELEGIALNFHPGGAVAASAVFYLLLALVLGLLQKFTSFSENKLLWVFVPLTFLIPVLGIHLSEYFIFDVKSWFILIIIYCFLASLCPMWLLLQPRGLLGGFVLYGALAICLLGLLFGRHDILQPAFKGFDMGGATGQLFPFLFVTIACGACSGFHGLVCSGTTSKQVDKESHVHSIGYGAMLAEGLVAVMALAIVMMMSPENIKGLKPGTIYGRGIGEFLTLFLGRERLPMAITFGAMAFSTFVFDTLDVSTRLGRYILEELFGISGLTGKIVGTLLTLIGPALILSFGQEEGMWTKFWTLFGSANQLLASLSLVTITYWLYSTGRKFLFTFIPMVFVLIITLWSLVSLTFSNFQQAQGFDISAINGVVSICLIGLGLYLMFAGLIKIKRDQGMQREEARSA